MTAERPGPGGVDGQRCVLVVDDDELLREVAKASLELVGGWRVQAVGSAAEAVAAAARQRPDAVLLDVMMPGVDGPAAAASLRGDPATRDIPIIFLTAKPQDDPGRWRALGLAGVIPKPFNPMTLAADIATLLGWPV